MSRIELKNDFMCNKKIKEIALNNLFLSQLQQN